MAMENNPSAFEGPSRRRGSKNTKEILRYHRNLGRKSIESHDIATRGRFVSCEIGMETDSALTFRLLKKKSS